MAPLAGLPRPAPAQDVPAGRAPEPYRVTVALAILQATVRDAKGEYVRGLKQERFRLLEDGKPREIVLFAEEPEAPVRIAFLLDVSGSMALQGRLAMARSAIRYTLDQLDAFDEAALFMFAEGTVDVVTDFTTDRWDLQEGLLTRDGYGRTALIDAVAKAPELVPQERTRRGAIMLFSDGVDNISRLSLDEAVELARRTPVPVYSVGLLDREEKRRRQQGAKVLQHFSQETGGEAFFADEHFHVNRASRYVVDELKQAYVLGYYPSPGPESHSLEVQADCKGCRVISRRGIYSQPAAPD